MVNSEDLTEVINRGVEVAELKRIAIQCGMKTLHQDSMLKVRNGVTTMEEALATVSPDMTVLKQMLRPIADCA
jgi:type IV pilus assembly protein PilB